MSKSFAVRRFSRSALLHPRLYRGADGHVWATEGDELRWACDRERQRKEFAKRYHYKSNSHHSKSGNKALR